MNRVLTILFFALSLTSWASQDDKIFLDANFNPVDNVSGAKYYRTVSLSEANTYYAEVFYLTDKPQMKANYLDEELTILHGLCTYYHKNGKVESTGKYAHGKKQGVWERFTLFGEKKADRFYPTATELEEKQRKASCLASFKSGKDELADYIEDNLRFPYQAEALDITEGEVTVNLLIDDEGKVTDFEILASTDRVFNQEAIVFIKTMPDWNPALWKGKAINSNYIIKLPFSADLSSQRNTTFQN